MKKEPIKKTKIEYVNNICIIIELRAQWKDYN